MKHKLASLAGWVGMILLIVDYALISNNIVSIDRPVYHVINITGSVGIIIASWVTRNYPSVGLNIVMMSIGAAALARILL